MDYRVCNAHQHFHTATSRDLGYLGQVHQDNQPTLPYVIARIIHRFLVVVAAFLDLILFYASDNNSVLFGEPIRILGYAGFLVNGDMNKLASDAREAEDFREEMTKEVKERLSHVDHSMTVFRMADFGNPGVAHTTQDRQDGGSEELSSLTSRANWYCV